MVGDRYKTKIYLWKKKMINLAHHPWVLDVLQLNTGGILLLELAATFCMEKAAEIKGKGEKSPKHGTEVGRVFHQNLPENHWSATYNRDKKRFSGRMFVDLWHGSLLPPATITVSNWPYLPNKNKFETNMSD